MLYIIGDMAKYEPLSREFLLERGYCCNHGCKNCPYKKISTTSHRETKHKTKKSKK